MTVIMMMTISIAPRPMILIRITLMSISRCPPTPGGSPRRWVRPPRVPDARRMSALGRRRPIERERSEGDGALGWIMTCHMGGMNRFAVSRTHPPLRDYEGLPVSAPPGFHQSSAPGLAPGVSMQVLQHANRDGSRHQQQPSRHLGVTLQGRHQRRLLQNLRPSPQSWPR